MAQLGQAIGAATAHCIGAGADLAAIRDAPDEFHRIARLDDAVEALITNDAAKLRYLSLASDVARLYSAILPDPMANQYNAERAALRGVGRQDPLADARPGHFRRDGRGG